jgi:peptidyl-prolyl cis-trans isomerase B (cyclophilin B)
MALRWPSEQNTRLQQAAAATNPIAVMTIDGQEVFIELFEDSAPNTVAAFIAMVDRGYYDDKPATFVHVGFRSIFGERADDEPMPEWMLPGEFELEGQRPHISGALAMLRNAAKPDSADTRFYVLHFPAPHLDGHRTIFGRIYSGLDVLRDMRGDEQVDSIAILRRRPHAYDATVITPDGERVKLGSLLGPPQVE